VGLKEEEGNSLEKSEKDLECASVTSAVAHTCKLRTWKENQEDGEFQASLAYM
jgi:hypothetical protein